MSTRAQRRQAIAVAIGAAFPGSPVFADPVTNLLQGTQTADLAFALSRGVRSLDPSVEMGAVIQNMSELWEVYFVIPRASSTATSEDRADAVFELLQDTLAPRTGFVPGGTGASEMELKEEDVWTRDAQAGSIYYAIYENDFWEG
jgi:hypothetical protein